VVENLDGFDLVRTNVGQITIPMVVPSLCRIRLTANSTSLNDACGPATPLLALRLLFRKKEGGRVAPDNSFRVPSCAGQNVAVRPIRSLRAPFVHLLSSASGVRRDEDA
jgi:hypothetical protein